MAQGRKGILGKWLVELHVPMIEEAAPNVEVDLGPEHFNWPRHLLGGAL